MKLLKYLILLVFSLPLLAQQPAAVLLPTPRACFTDQNGSPLVGGFVYSYLAGTTTASPTYTDSTGTIQNSNPVTLDSSGCASIWIGPRAYKIILKDSTNSQMWMTDNVSDVGQLAYSQFVYLSPVGQALQTIIGPLAAQYFSGTSPHTTSPGVRVSILAPSYTLDTTSNPPSVSVTQPAVANQVYTIPDPGALTGAFILSPNNTTNTLDCTQAGITCKRRAYVYFEGAGCNNATAGLGWDTFPNFSPVPICITGTNIQKGVMALPAAATYIQENTGTGAAAGTCTTTYTNTTVAGNLLVVSVAVDGGKTVTGVSDGTNAYTKAINKTNGNTDLEIWYFNGTSTSKTAGTTLTVTLSAAANCALDWKEYTGLTAPIALDVTASNSGTGTAVTTGTTAGTAQASNLVIAAVASPSNPSVVSSSGWVRHSVVAQSTNVTVADAGKISNTVSTQAGGFTLGSSQAWASAIVTFKVSTAGNVLTMRTWRIPSVYRSTDAVNVTANWQNPLQATGTVTALLDAALACTAPGSTDDPAWLSATSSLATVSQTSAGIVTETAMNSLTSTGCAPNGLMHVQLGRYRYDPQDTYEGYIYVNGAALDYGSSN